MHTVMFISGIVMNFVGGASLASLGFKGLVAGLLIVVGTMLIILS